MKGKNCNNWKYHREKKIDKPQLVSEHFLNFFYENK